MKIGFIGQGYVGKNYANNFEDRGYDVVRFSKEAEYVANEKQIFDCEVVFIAVPTPTVKGVFDDSIVLDVFKYIKPGSTVVIKSTIALGVTEKIAQVNPDYFVFHSPEFLSERSAKYDVDFPHASIVGMGIVNDEYKKRGEYVLSILQDAPFKKLTTGKEAELIKYSRNVHGFYEIMFYNMFYDLCNSLQIDYEVLKEYFKFDPLHLVRYANPIFDSGHKRGLEGRGAGGHCFLKDFKAFSEFANENMKDKKYKKLFEALENINLELLINSKKDLDFVDEVYGKDFKKRFK